MEIPGAAEVRTSCHIIMVEALPRLEAMVAEHNRRVERLSKRHKI